MSGCLQRPLRRRAREPTLKWGKRVGLCYGSRYLIPLGYRPEYNGIPERWWLPCGPGTFLSVWVGNTSRSSFWFSNVHGLGGMLTDPRNILYNRIIRWSRRRSANGRYFRSSRSCVTLTDPHWPCAQRAAFLCTFSMESESLLRMGSQMLEQYSSWDLVRAMKAVSRHLYGLPRRLRLIKPNRWWALLTIVATCWGQFKSCVRVTPKYIACDTDCNIWLFNW